MAGVVSGIATWLVAGLVTGAAGKLLLPGPPLGWLAALGLGILGSLTGGAAATWLGMGGAAELAPRAVILALLSAALLVIVAQLLRTLRERRPSGADTR